MSSSNFLAISQFNCIWLQNDFFNKRKKKPRWRGKKSFKSNLKIDKDCAAIDFRACLLCVIYVVKSKLLKYFVAHRSKGSSSSSSCSWHHYDSSFSSSWFFGWRTPRDMNTDGVGQPSNRAAEPVSWLGSSCLGMWSSSWSQLHLHALKINTSQAAKAKPGKKHKQHEIKVEKQPARPAEQLTRNTPAREPAMALTHTHTQF